MGRLDGKVALISGAARGQGAEEARLFAEEGAKVILGDIEHEEGQRVAQEVGGIYVPLNVAKEADWIAAVAVAEEKFGALHILVNNAAILRRAPIEDCTLEEYEQVIAVNQTGVFLGIKSAVRLMKRTGGSIVNISSTAGIRGPANNVAYVASKFAIRGMTKVAANEFAKYGIRVNSVHPGLIETPMIDPFFDDEAIRTFAARQLINRLGTSREVAEMVLFLASDASSYSTGAEFICDGGVTTGNRP
ncbi:SDR family NAD(P)-dependent oxidoreductase [Neorhizobium sp. P12A]|uniref:SDR family NAD(P)-dependent oxidoreductase n=1 Tax=Rhizobium/Agrobacterium group TaxID=227290 RepID=UPI001048D3C6|nr:MULTISPECIES: SDR family oxidoreductase [Rhizobium/Agrobacterium group]KAA0698331.1 SDR family NAD(P)-dependent oxidoreductase [Neorhizobium sp. P12A]TCR92892.1 3alpha(or 20beta)-hydroxysteroid dehydrogenase [Rhizobium sp. BK376]